MDNIEFKAEFASHSDKEVDKYITSLTGCTCKDFKFSKEKRPCKHMLYLAYSIGALQLNSEKFNETKAKLVNSIRSNSMKNKVLLKKNTKLAKLIKKKEKD